MTTPQWARWLSRFRRSPQAARAATPRPRSRPTLEGLEDRTVPATLFVDNMGDFTEFANHGGAPGVVEVGDEVIWNPGAGSAHGGPVGASGGLFFGQIVNDQGAFASLGAAVSASAAGDTVRVAAGAFAEAVVVDKALTLLGNQTGVDVNAGRTVGGAAETVIQATAGAGFSVSASGVSIGGFTITAGIGGLQGIVETTSVVGTTVRENFVHGLTAALGVSIAAGSSNFLVTENEVFNNYAGVYLSNAAFGGTVSANIIRDHTVAVGLDAGSGVVLEGINPNITITQNLIAGNRHGVYVWTGFGSDLGGTAVVANSITGNTIAGVNNTNTAVLNAGGNWWGSATGPSVASNLGGSGDVILDAGAQVDYSPWLSTSSDLSAVIGFQADLSQLTVNDLSPRNAAQVAANVGNIQEGINLATPSASATIVLKEGTYVGDVNVNKTVRLIGDATINGNVTASVVGAVLDPGVGLDAGVFTINGNLSLQAGSRFTTQINGTAVGTNLDRINVNGTVALNGAVLDASLGFTPAIGTTFVLINNDGTDAVVAGGTFAGLAQGSQLTLNGQQFRVSYTGGDGNDVTLTRVLTNIRFRVRNQRGRQVIDVINGDTNAVIRTITPFGPNFRGRIRIAVGDVTGDLIPDVVVVKVSGFGPIVQVFSGETGARVTAFRPFPRLAFGRFSVRVAAYNNDTRPDIFVTLRRGNVIRTRVFSGVDFRLLAAFRATAGASATV